MEDLSLENTGKFMTTLFDEDVSFDDSKKENKEEDKTVGTINTRSNLVAYGNEDFVKKTKDSLSKGYTMIGVKVLDGDSLNFGKFKRDDPSKLSLENASLEELRARREKINALREDKEQTLVEEKGYSMKMTPLKNVGFASTGSLIVFLGVLYTIVEFALIILRVCK